MTPSFAPVAGDNSGLATCKGERNADRLRQARVKAR